MSHGTPERWPAWRLAGAGGGLAHTGGLLEQVVVTLHGWRAGSHWRLAGAGGGNATRVAGWLTLEACWSRWW